MEKSTLLWGFIGVMFIFTLYLTFQVAAQGDVSVAAPVVKAASSGMVGGC